MIKQVQDILGLTAPTEAEKATIARLVSSVTAKVLAYCRLRTLDDAPALKLVIPEICARQYRAAGFSGDTAETGPVQSVSDNGQSVTYNTSALIANATTSFTDDEKAMLNEWRRLW